MFPQVLCGAYMVLDVCVEFGFGFDSSVAMSISVSFCLSRILISHFAICLSLARLYWLYVFLFPRYHQNLIQLKFCFQFPVDLSLVSYSVEISEKCLVHTGAWLLSSITFYQIVYIPGSFLAVLGIFCS